MIVGIGLGAITLLLVGYEKRQENQATQIINVLKSPEVAEAAKAQIVESNSAEQSNNRLNQKIDRLSDSLLSLKTRVYSLSNFQGSDTIRVSDSNSIVMDSFKIKGEDIYVERDVLLSTELVRINILNNQSKTDSNNVLIDSLKTALNIIADPPVEFLQIEFWKSPLNYRGYKMSKSTLVVYGLINELILSVYADNGFVFLTTNESNYQFEQTIDFKELCIVARP